MRLVDGRDGGGAVLQSPLFKMRGGGGGGGKG